MLFSQLPTHKPVCYNRLIMATQPFADVPTAIEDFRAGRWWWEDEAAKDCGLHATKASETAPA